MTNGFFITFEGIEGSGKTTLMGLVADGLRAGGVEPLLTREPGGTPLGEAVRRAILDPAGPEMAPMAELMLFAADRAQHVATVIGPALDDGRVVLCDRFCDATEAYQGHGRGLPMDVIRAVDGAARGGLLPDMTVLLDLPVRNGLRRAEGRNALRDARAESRIDDEDAAFHERVREGYLAAARREPERFIVLDGLLEPDVLSERVLEELKGRYHGVF